MTTSVYTDQPTIEAYLQRSLTTNEATLANGTLIDATAFWLDNAINSTFEPASPSQRYYHGGEVDTQWDAYSTHPFAHGYNSISIDPCHDITNVQYIDPMGNVSPVLITPQMIVYEPANSFIKDEIRLRFQMKFPVGEQNILVSATFTENDPSLGGNGVPADIRMAATRMVARIIKASADDYSASNLTAESLGDHRVQYEPTQDWIGTIALQDPIVCKTIEQRRDPII